MNCEVKMTATAKQDFKEIAQYIYEQSKEKHLALRFVKELQNKCNILKEFPQCGSLPDDRILISLGYRFLIYKDYLIFYIYKKEDNTVYIIAVFNAKRDYLRVMRKFI